MDVDFPEKLAFLFEPHRYKVAKGGRFGLKSWSFARALLMICAQPCVLWPGRTEPVRVLCARETQKSISESVHQLLQDQIGRLGLESAYRVKQSDIECANGGYFAFAGIRQNVQNIKSYEGFDIAWVEEAQAVSRNSWNVLIPTIRKEGSEIWVSFNPDLEADDTNQRFSAHPPPDAVVAHTTWRDNPWLTDTMRGEIEYLREKSPDDYLHVYEGLCKQSVEGAVYRAELAAAEKEGRLARVPYDPQIPVETYWDLGWGDNTSIWFAQALPMEFHVIDHLSGCLLPLQHYVKLLQERPYIYRRHWLPHDARAHELGSGKSIEEQLKAVFGADKVRVTSRLSVQDGIAAVRAIFPRCWFDAEKCADGIQSLRHYRYERDEDRGTFRREPLHDWASHDADALRTLGLAIRSAERPKELPRPRFQRPASAWS